MKTIKNRAITLALAAVATVSIAYNIFPCFILPPEQVSDIWGLIFSTLFFLAFLEAAFFNKVVTLISLSLAAVFGSIAYLRFYPLIVSALHKDINSILPYLFSLLTYGIALFCFICSRSRLGAVLLFVAGIFVFFFQILTGFVVYVHMQLIFFTAVGVLFLHTSYIKNAQKYKKESKWSLYFALLSTVLCLLTVMGGEYLYNNSAAISNISTLSWDDIPKPLRDVLEDNIYATGFSNYDDQRELGGALWYNYSTVLDVKTSRAFYLRGRVYNTYSGRAWLIDESDYDSDSNNALYWMNAYYYAVNREYFMERYFKDPENAALNYFKNFDGGTIYQYMYVRYRYPFGNIFLPLNNLTNIEEYDYGTDLSVSKRMQKGSTYDSFSVNVNTYSQRYSYLKDHYNEIYRNLLAEPRLADLVRDMNAAQAKAVEDYTGLDHISLQTIALAQEITKDCKTDLEKIEVIKKYLSGGENLLYKTSTVPPPSNQDFVSNFLFVTKKGYCVHFASAAVAMMRAVGIPARYVEGYISPLSRDGEYYRVSNKDSHAWAEAYTPLTGFITVEVTPGFERIPQGEYIPETSSSSSTTSEQEAVSIDMSRSYTEPQRPKDDFGEMLVWMAASLGLALAVTALGGIFKLLYRKLWFAWITAKKDSTAAIISLYDLFLRDLNILGLKRNIDETPYEYSERIFGKINFIQKETLRVDFSDVTKIAVKARYSKNEITDEEYRKVIQFYRVFFPSCRRYFGLWRYALRFFLL